MSERPPTNELLVAELYGWKWDSRYDTADEVVPVISDVLTTRPDLATFCDRMRRLHTEADTGMGPPSWRDFRVGAVQPRFTAEFDRDRLYYEIEGLIRHA